MDLYTVRKQLNMGMPLTSIKLRVTDYARVSTDHLEQKKSLQNQVEHFEQYIKENPNWTYVKGYVDDGITGTSDVKRDNFMKMIEDARSGKFDLIVTKEISLGDFAAAFNGANAVSRCVFDLTSWFSINLRENSLYVEKYRKFMIG